MNVEAFILVGGRSNRMGRDKASIGFGATTLVEKAANTITEAMPVAKVTLVAANDQQFAPVSSLVYGHPMIFDIHQNRGPLGGIHAAMAFSNSPWIFVLACDMPFVTAELIRFLDVFKSGDVDAVIPEQSDGNLQPLCGFYRVAGCLPIIEKLLEGNMSESMFGALKRVKTKIVKADRFSDLAGFNHLFVNLNTPEDVRRSLSDFFDATR